MPIQLDKILADIAEEKALHPNSLASKIKKDHDDAWIKVGKKNKLSAHEAKSIFKVLQKKFEQEKLKSSSTWKLYQQMEDIHRKEEAVKPKSEPEPAEAEDESFVEFLEVREEDEDDDDDDSDTQDKSMKSSESTGSPEKEKENTNHIDPKPEQKLLNTQMMMHHGQSHNTSASAVSAAFSNVLQKKGISMRKTVPVQSKQQASSSPPTKATVHQKPSGAEATRTVALPTEALKRKASAVGKAEESAPSKKAFTTIAVNATSAARTTASPPTPSLAQLQQIEIKQEIVDDALEALATTGEPINVITIPSNPPTVTTDLPNGVENPKTNGFNTRIEDIDFHKDIIFDNNLLNASKPTTAPGDIINLGNFDNQLPPTFFKNLCNSHRHEALGLYVANVMNRVSGKTAAKLELSILKAIIEAKTEELARL